MAGVAAPSLNYLARSDHRSFGNPHSFSAVGNMGIDAPPTWSYVAFKLRKLEQMWSQSQPVSDTDLTEELETK
jgi:hypothetical protein